MNPIIPVPVVCSKGRMKRARRCKDKLVVVLLAWRGSSTITASPGLAAVKQNGWALQFAAESCKGDREMVLAAVKQNGCALLFADDLELAAESCR
eukprot:2175430-Amphidinium_carterae.1